MLGFRASARGRLLLTVAAVLCLLSGGAREATGAARAASATVFGATGASLASWLTGADLTGSTTTASDIWGYTSPAGREYAIIGLGAGVAFVEITDPEDPRVVARVPGPASIWRDIKTYGPWAYVVNETGDGLQVIDLRGIDAGDVHLTRTVTDLGLRTAHNLAINETSGYAYLLSSNLGRGGLLVADLADPANPALEPVMWDVTSVHDAVVVSYESGRYQGREIAFAFTGPQGLHLVDVTDKTAPRTLSHLLYKNATFGHSGSLSTNRRYLFLNDELDERSNPAVHGMTTYVIRISDLEAPRLVRARRWGLPVIDHNSMVQGNRLYLSAYEGGLRIVDIARPTKPRMIGFFDTHPEDNSVRFAHPEDDSLRFAGAWGVYAGFASGLVVVSDIERGLFVIRPR